MRPAQTPPQWRNISAAPMSKQSSSASVHRRLISKAPHSNLLRRLLGPRRFSKWLSSFAQRFRMDMTTLDRHIPILSAIQTPAATLTGRRGIVHMQMARPELLLPASPPQQIEIDTRCGIQEQKEDAGLADKAVAWMLAPVFFCCVVAEKAKPPQAWEATEIFSRVVVSFMLKLLVLATDLTRGEQHKRAVGPLEEGK
ncbi:hypothetical protein PHYPSEUDO_003692 [Phytophthora pseudosyringae]|uniref:Uncharacterized protein n=1 Tax=Phytophthora pseudosyringae TaxID=221518 RepID=A0A8T1VQZ6_9STRA|nr:hypothetical protein PHYPSEUDO_003692 [Phytophthora pseudosyringae]